MSLNAASRELEQQLNRLHQEVEKLKRHGRNEEVIDLDTLARDMVRRHLEQYSPFHAGALPRLRQAVEITRAALGEHHPVYAKRLNGLALLHLELGDYAAALPLLRETLEITRAAVGEDHPDYAKRLNGLARVYTFIGDYAAALRLFRQAARTLGVGDSDYAESLSGLVSVYLTMTALGGSGDTARRALVQQADRIRRAAVGEDHPDYARRLLILARVYSALRGRDAALPLLRQAAEIRRAARLENDAAGLIELARMHFELNDYPAALPLLHQALEITRAAVGEDHLDYAVTLHLLAEYYQAMGDRDAALPPLRQAAEIERAALGEHHPRYATSLSWLADSLIARRQADEAWLADSLMARRRAEETMPLLEQLAAIDDRMIGQIFSVASERQRMAFLDKVLVNFHRFLSTALKHSSNSPTAIRAALDLVLRRKAIAAEATAAQRDAVLGGKYPALRPQLAELDALRNQIARAVARAVLASPEADGLVAHQPHLAEWSAERERLEAELARLIPEMNLEQKLHAADHRTIALSLPEHVILIEFVRVFVRERGQLRLEPLRDLYFPPGRGDDPEDCPIFLPRTDPDAWGWEPANYVAFVLVGGAPDDVRMIDLGDAQPIDRLVTEFRARIMGRRNARPKRDMTRQPSGCARTKKDKLGRALCVAVFERIVQALGPSWPRPGPIRLLIASDGALAHLPFEVLPTTGGRFVIDDFQISYLSCGRDVLRFGAAATGRPDLPLVVADPDFNLQAKARPAQGREHTARQFGRHSRDGGRDADHFCILESRKEILDAVTRDQDRRDSNDDFLCNLSGMRPEGQRIAALLGVEPWLGANALEGRLKAECHSPRILHLVTHGFFLPDPKYERGRQGFDTGWADDSKGGEGVFHGPIMKNPMLRSGLALAGANTWLKAGNLPDEAEDGLLTAEEVAGLDLLNTELVVLSACETGLGQVQFGEGVFGLRRAFGLAGAKTLVMSLWKVSDEETRELMVDFYGRLLAGEGRAEALRQAQLAMKAKYPDPFYWGAFICQGDPSPLSTVRPGMAATGVATD
jgi:tetratricopeptide (TPR) repeat protein